VKDAHGSKRDSYPFLLDSNEQDKALIRNLLVYRPFLQKKGEQTTAWTNVVEMTFETTLPTGKKVFSKKISTTDAAIKSCKKRLADYVDFMKKYRATMPTHNSGGDNELFSDNLRALEDLYDLHESFKNTTNEKKILPPMPGPVIVPKAMLFAMQALDCLLLCAMEEVVRTTILLKKKTTIRCYNRLKLDAMSTQSTIDETPHHIRCIALVENQFRIQMKTMLKERRVRQVRQRNFIQGVNECVQGGRYF
jgi:hypothetical protein